MRIVLLLLCFLIGISVASGVEFPRGVRKIDVSGKTQVVKEVEIILPASNKILEFAAAELKRFL